MSETPQKTGIWTAHVDPASGRTFYFNLVHNRSYWHLPPDILAQVRTPVIDTLREWDPEAAARYDQPTSSEELERQRKKREEVLQAAAVAAATEGNPSAATASVLHERMTIAAAQKRAEEMKRMTLEQKIQNANDNEYLSMVRELQAKDRDTESTGGKWLVR